MMVNYETTYSSSPREEPPASCQGHEAHRFPVVTARYSSSSQGEQLKAARCDEHRRSGAKLPLSAASCLFQKSDETLPDAPFFSSSRDSGFVVAPVKDNEVDCRGPHPRRRKQRQYHVSSSDCESSTSEPSCAPRQGSASVEARPLRRENSGHRRKRLRQQTARSERLPFSDLMMRDSTPQGPSPAEPVYLSKSLEPKMSRCGQRPTAPSMALRKSVSRIATTKDHQLITPNDGLLPNSVALLRDHRVATVPASYPELGGSASAKEEGGSERPTTSFGPSKRRVHSRPSCKRASAPLLSRGQLSPLLSGNLILGGLFLLAVIWGCLCNRGKLLRVRLFSHSTRYPPSYSVQQRGFSNVSFSSRASTKLNLEALLANDWNTGALAWQFGALAATCFVGEDEAGGCCCTWSQGDLNSAWGSSDCCYQYDGSLAVGSSPETCNYRNASSAIRDCSMELLNFRKARYAARSTDAFSWSNRELMFALKQSDSCLTSFARRVDVLEAASSHRVLQEAIALTRSSGNVPFSGQGTVELPLSSSNNNNKNYSSNAAIPFTHCTSDPRHLQSPAPSDWRFLEKSLKGLSFFVTIEDWEDQEPSTARGLSAVNLFACTEPPLSSLFPYGPLRSIFAAHKARPASVSQDWLKSRAAASFRESTGGVLRDALQTSQTWENPLEFRGRGVFLAGRRRNTTVCHDYWLGVPLQDSGLTTGLEEQVVSNTGHPRSSEESRGRNSRGFQLAARGQQHLSDVHRPDALIITTPWSGSSPCYCLSGVARSFISGAWIYVCLFVPWVLHSLSSLHPLTLIHIPRLAFYVVMDILRYLLLYKYTAWIDCLILFFTAGRVKYSLRQSDYSDHIVYLMTFSFFCILEFTAAGRSEAYKVSMARRRNSRGATASAMSVCALDDTASAESPTRRRGRYSKRRTSGSFSSRLSNSASRDQRRCTASAASTVFLRDVDRTVEQSINCESSTKRRRSRGAELPATSSWPRLKGTRGNDKVDETSITSTFDATARATDRHGSTSSSPSLSEQLLSNNRPSPTENHRLEKKPPSNWRQILSTAKTDCQYFDHYRRALRCTSPALLSINLAKTILLVTAAFCVYLSFFTAAFFHRPLESLVGLCVGFVGVYVPFWCSVKSGIINLDRLGIFRMSTF